MKIEIIMKNILFLQKQEFPQLENVYIAYIKRIDEKSLLLDELYRQLNFPDYFGWNWDAVFDCLTDFNWIKEKKIMLVHHSIIKLDSISLKIYLNILIDAVNRWKDSDDHIFEVVFSIEEEFRIRQILSELME